MTHKDFDTANTNPRDSLRNLSTQDFLSFGIHQVAYVRSVEVEGKRAFAIHAADGTPLSVMDTMDSAMGIVRHNDLEPATVH